MRCLCIVMLKHNHCQCYFIMKKLLFLCASVALLFSCSNQKSSLISIFEQTENISHVSIIQPPISRSPYGLALYDTLLVWIDPYDDKHLSLFDIRNGNQIHRFGFIGKGPGEMLMWPSGRKYQQNYFHIYDNQQKQILVFPIADIANDSEYRPQISYKFDEITTVSTVVQINDSLFIGENSHSDSIYALVDNKKSIIFTGHNHPEDNKKNISSIVKSIAYQGHFYQNPDDNTLLVHIGINGVVIDILKIENNIIVRKDILKYVLPKYKPFHVNGMSSALMDDDSIIGCCDVSVTGDFIYILYADKTEVNEGNKSNSRCSDFILVFDWNGQPVKYYKSDIDLYQICVSDDNHAMYGVTMNPEAELVKFTL